jgi:hypothetical protein
MKGFAIFKRGEKQMIENCGVIVLSAALLCSAGPNSTAEFFFDFNPATEAIDSVGQCPAESTITVPLRISGASRLYDYQFYIRYDTAQLRYLSAQKGNTPIGNVLETNGGSCLFTGKRSINDSTKILIGCALLGSEASECVSGAGLLGLITFKKKHDDTSFLSISTPLCEDCNLTPDTGMQCHGATIISSPAAVFPRKVHTSRETVTMVNGRVHLQLPGAVSYTLSVFDPRGRKVYSAAGYASAIDVNARQAPIASGVSILRVSYLNRELVLPLVIPGNHAITGL